MKKHLLLSIALLTLSFSVFSQTVARLDSSYSYQIDADNWQFTSRTLYDPNTPAHLSLIHHDRLDQTANGTIWTVLCDDSIVIYPNAKAHYTLSYLTNEYFFLNREVTTLFPDGQVHTREFQLEDANGKLDNGSNKVEFAYTSTGKLESESLFYWNPADDNFIIQKRTSYTYNSNDQVSSKSFERLYQNNFDFYQKEEYHYNSLEKLEKTDFYVWTNGIWDKRTKAIKTYSQDEKLMTEVKSRYLFPGLPDTRDSAQFEYDIQGRLIQKTSYDVVNQISTPRMKITYSYGELEPSESRVEFSFVNGAWEERIRDEKTWTSEGDLAEHFHKEALNSNSDYLLINYYTYLSTEVEPTEPILCKMPNPLSSDISLNCSVLDPAIKYEINVFDLQGRRVARGNIQQGQQLSLLTGLNSGLYLIRVSDGDKLIFREKSLVLAE